jgi:hypothetical protein
MPTATYIALANYTTPNSSASTITFSSIPATYRDLVLVVQPIGTSLVTGRVRFNGDSGSNYNYVTMRHDGTTPSSASGTTTQFDLGTFVVFQSTSIHLINIMDYSATDKHKTVLIRNNNAQRAEGTEAQGGRWASTSAITSIAISVNSGTFGTGSNVALYGIVS